MTNETPASTSAVAEPWLATYASDHHLKITWIGVLGLGLLWLLTFFMTISYFPNFDLQAGVNVLLSLTFVGVFFSLLFSLACLIPSLYIGFAIRGKPPLVRTARFREEVAAWSLFLFCSFGALNLILMAYMKWDWAFEYSFLLYISIVLGIAAFQGMRAIKRKHTRAFRLAAGREDRLAKRATLINSLYLARIGHALIAGTLQLVPWIFLGTVLSRASDLPEDDFLSFMTIGPYWGAVIAIAGAIVVSILIPRSNRRWYALIALIVFVMPLLLTLFAQAGGMFPMLVAQRTKIGNFRADRIVVSPKSCPALAPALGINCEEDKSVVQLCNVHVVSRIGTETYLRLTNRVGTKGQHDVVNILLPSSDIEAMELNPDKRNLRLAGINVELQQRNSLCNPDVSNLSLFADNAFDFDSLTVTEEGRKDLLPLIKTAVSSVDLIEKISVIGHTDRIGSEQYNDRLAQQRAEQVQILIARGLRNVIPKIKIESESKGSSEPLATKCAIGKNRRACEAPNRRVDVVIHFKDRSKEKAVAEARK